MTSPRRGRQGGLSHSWRKHSPRLEGLEGRQLLTVVQLAGLPGLTAVEATTFSGAVGTFTDSDPGAAPAGFSATINWGDGTISPGTVTEVNAGTFSIAGFHTYARFGSYSIGLSVTDPHQQTTTIGNSTHADLVSNLPGGAQSTDPNLVGPVSLTSTADNTWWVADARKGIAAAYSGSTGSPSPTTITIPASAASPSGALGSPTAIVSATTSGIVDPSGVPYTLFFATRDGTISAWNSGPSASLRVDLSSQGASFEGLAVVLPYFYPYPAGDVQAESPVYYAGNSGSLYATDFHNAQIDVFDANFKPESLQLIGLPAGTPLSAIPVHLLDSSASFSDPNLPAGYAPFGIQQLNGEVYVTYAQQDAAKLDPVAGPGKGLIDVYSTTGYFLHRLTTGGALNAPYGLALAPSSFGSFAGDLLVSNTGDGRINAYDPNTGAFKGQLEDNTGQPLDGLRGIAFGPNTQSDLGGPLYFTAAPNGGADGLFGTIAPVTNGPATSIQVNDAPLQGQGTTFSGVEEAPLSVPLVVARFSDADPNASAGDFTATIDWGDGTLGNGTVSTALYPPGAAQPTDAAAPTFSVIASQHTYAEDGTYHVTVNIRDAGGSTVAVESVAEIASAPITASPVPVSAFVGSYLYGTVATFSESPSGTGVQTLSNTSDFTATIDWGDGTTSAGDVTWNWGSYLVAGGHAYTSTGANGTYPVTIFIRDDDGTTTQVVSTASVYNPPPVLAPVTFQAAAGQPFSGTVANAGPVPGPIGSYSATINWGDGTTSPGAIVPNDSSGFSVQGTHTYAGRGAAAYPVTVTIDQRGPSASAVSTAVLAGTPIGLTGGLSPASDTGPSNTDGVTGDAEPTFVGTASPGAFVVLLVTPESRGQPRVAGSGFANASGDWQIATTPLAGGRYLITAVATDGSTGATAVAAIMPANHPLIIDTRTPTIPGTGSNPALADVIVNGQANLFRSPPSTHRSAGHHPVARHHPHRNGRAEVGGVKAAMSR